MNDQTIRQTLKAVGIAAGFVALGLFALSENARAVGWATILTFGGMSVLALGAILYRAITGRPAIPGHSREIRGATVVLRDGRDYTLAVGNDVVVLRHRASGEEKRFEWSALTEVYLMAIDHFPVGSISYLVHSRNSPPLEIPLDAEGNDVLLAAMQARLPGFDNDAVIKAMGMMHGLVKVWSHEPDAARAPSTR